MGLKINTEGVSTLATETTAQPRGGVIWVTGSDRPNAAEKHDCIDALSRYAMDGWAIAADPRTPIGRLAAIVARAAHVPFVAVGPDGLPLQVR